MKNNILKPVITLFIICLITTSALVGTNILTRDRIEKLKVENEERSRQQVLSVADSFTEEDEYVVGKNSSGKIVGYVFTTETKGYGGTISVMTGVSADGEVTGVVILEHSETVGLGANTSKPAFLDQYVQKIPDNLFSVTKAAPASGEIQAVTGATISSRAVTAAVNEALDIYSKLKGRE